ncbi:uncharacterized protein P174DRAFT_452343 [Aspergillus novofumigatus IBT 16806]|uniref:Uncharacterized protein n=1 Tax=Aspergillus novofumigatus (strain IBT 16806) TaxID=1392255 RepID=A0A2I1C635_ASPN1|nr:uncharacterized protein P174DRAFT_452343 [Aspergillus novofumigatus IBT 16806]PKX93109.1 hypothetical protein P174DRAFT_452343 [Aspergillus novofumigatus IBT 16806]
MDEEAIERLKRLQMEDLGTLRREYISTVDTKKFRNIRLEDIEATRMINVAGSDAARLAQANQARLNAWANAHKDLGDSADQEPLDHLLNGQNHRLGLRAVIEGSGGQSYLKSTKKNDSFPQVAGRAPSGRSASTRGSKTTGRGGGVIGTRGRETKQTSPDAQTRVTHQGAVAKLGNHVVQSPHARKHLQDPALDINNEPPKISRDVSGSKLQTVVKGGVKRDLVLLKTRRPVGNTDWSRLSPPEDFLSIARDSLVNGRSSDVPTTVRTMGSEQTQVTGAVDHETPQSINQPEETNAGRAYEDSIVSFRSDGDSVAVATPASSNNGQSLRVNIAQAAHTASERDQWFEPSRLQSPQQGKPQHVKSTSEQSDDKAQDGKQNQDDALVDVSTPPSGSSTIVQSKDLYSANVQAEGRTGILLDFNSTPPRKSLPGAEDSLSMSPALQDLEGINFQANVAQSVLSRPEPRPEPQIYSFVKTEPVGSKDSSSPRIGESSGDTMTSTPDGTPSNLASLREKLARLYKFVEETLRHHVPEPLRDMDLQALRTYEQELKEILSLHQRTVQETASQTAEERQEILSSHKPQETEAQTAAEGKHSKISSPTPSVCSPLVKAPPEEGNSRLSLRSEGTPSPSKFNVQAKEFVPTVAARNPSFSGWRDTKPSPPSSTTSESRTGQSQHSRQNSQDHMLIDSTASLSSRSASQLPPRGRLASENHIFGDHLLPGRGRLNGKTHGNEALSPDKNALKEPNDARPKFLTATMPQALTVPRARPSVPESINTHGTSNSESAKFTSASCSTGERSPRLVGLATAAPGSGSNGVKSNSDSGPSTPTPVPKAVKAVHKAISKRSAISQVIALQRSMHAPKVQEDPTAMRNPSPSALGSLTYATPVVQKPTVAAPENRKSSGLQGSRWASSETQKPLR